MQDDKVQQVKIVRRIAHFYEYQKDIHKGSKGIKVSPATVIKRVGAEGLSLTALFYCICEALSITDCDFRHYKGVHYIKHLKAK